MTTKTKPTPAADLRYPLNWPSDTPRHLARERKADLFDKRLTIYKAIAALKTEIRRINGTHLLLSSNLRVRLDGEPFSDQRSPDDPAVAAYFIFEGEDRVLPCDTWHRVQANIYAIARYIENERANARYGVGDLKRTFTGYKALAAPNGYQPPTWWGILDVDQLADVDTIRAAFRERAKTAHPDLGGTTEQFVVLKAAFDEALRQRG